ncbi:MULTISPECIES: hypothetical protein [Streptomyces]|jgi:Spy/CpxP family protein refolding chaperone|uniref:Spy/CpxP family protein refolding chaperone n=1 Tax=Streptomyces nymphaeiformis TaxID=2663842 RepID=A0A7W7XFW6_9ACTN|nr:hypothetical protein [Streptomyces nymphaeiformis]MBB4986702.1 Spy/CpxP family protein refolding chaperone [Streptomyces nymphaeiformis]
MKKLIATALFTGAFALGTATYAPAALTGSTSQPPPADHMPHGAHDLPGEGPGAEVADGKQGGQEGRS